MVRQYGLSMAQYQYLQKKMGCIKALVLGDDSAAEVDTTCLEETDTKTSDYGLTTPGEGSISIDTDPKNLSHTDFAAIGIHKRKSSCVCWLVRWCFRASFNRQ